MRILEPATNDKLTSLYREIVVPAFPPDELMSVDELEAGVRLGTTRVTAAVDERGAPAACAVAEWSPASRVLLLSYLAVAGSGRGRGVGGSLYRHVLGEWTAQYGPCLFVAEVEHPDQHAGSAAHGDPLRRLRFYGAHGARVLRLPYFQPALRQGSRRIYGMLLLALHVDPPFTGPRPDSVAGAPLALWMQEYLAETEGPAGGDPAAAALLDALAAADGVALLDVERYREVPVALAPGR
jgi:hypothetical protein